MINMKQHPFGIVNKTDLPLKQLDEGVTCRSDLDPEVEQLPTQQKQFKTQENAELSTTYSFQMESIEPEPYPEFATEFSQMKLLQCRYNNFTMTIQKL